MLQSSIQARKGAAATPAWPMPPRAKVSAKRCVVGRVAAACAIQTWLLAQPASSAPGRHRRAEQRPLHAVVGAVRAARLAVRYHHSMRNSGCGAVVAREGERRRARSPAANSPAASAEPGIALREGRPGQEHEQSPMTLTFIAEPLQQRAAAAPRASRSAGQSAASAAVASASAEERRPLPGQQQHRQPPAEGADVDDRGQHPGEREPERQRQQRRQRREAERRWPSSSATSARRRDARAPRAAPAAPAARRPASAGWSRARCRPPPASARSAPR